MNVESVFEKSPLLTQARKYMMRRPRVEIPRMTLGTRVMRVGVAGGSVEEGSPVVPDFTSITLNSELTLATFQPAGRLGHRDGEGPEVATAKVLEEMVVRAAIRGADNIVASDESVPKAVFRAGRALPSKYWGTPDKVALVLSTEVDYNQDDWHGPVIRTEFLAPNQFLITSMDNLIVGIIRNLMFGDVELSSAFLVDEQQGVVLMRADAIVQNPEALVFGEVQ